LAPEELAEARKSKFYGDFRYKPGAEATTSTVAPTPTLASTSGKKIVFSEPAPSTAAPVTADSSSEEEKVLQVLISTESDDEITGVAAALARLSLRKAVQL
jgi:hypothetical protein